MIEALWAVNFSTAAGAFGSGVVVLETGRIFGGDSQYYYLGDYAVNGNTVRGKVDAVHYSGPPMNIFGPIEKLTLQFEGQNRGDTMLGCRYRPDPPAKTPHDGIPAAAKPSVRKTRVAVLKIRCAGDNGVTNSQ